MDYHVRRVEDDDEKLQAATGEMAANGFTIVSVMWQPARTVANGAWQLAGYVVIFRED